MTEPKIKVVDYKTEHLLNIKARLKDCFTSEEPTEITAPAATLMCHGDPVAIFGGYLVSSRVLQVWGLVSHDVRKHPISFHKTVRLFVEYQFERLKLRRMQMSVRAGNTEGWNWARSLGFYCEGIMKQYGADGADYWLFARIQ